MLAHSEHLLNSQMSQQNYQWPMIYCLLDEHD